MAVCADVYAKEEKNYFFGKPRDQKDPSKLDDREFVTNVFVVFFTSHLTADGEPSYVHTRMSFTWGGSEKPSNLFKFVHGWFPSATPERIRDMDLNKLVGQAAYITVSHNEKGYASVTNAATPPPGAQAPAIPPKFKRKNTAAEAPAVTSDPQVAYQQTMSGGTGPSGFSSPMGLPTAPFGTAATAAPARPPLPTNPNPTAYQGQPEKPKDHIPDGPGVPCPF